MTIARFNATDSFNYLETSMHKQQFTALLREIMQVNAAFLRFLVA